MGTFNNISSYIIYFTSGLCILMGIAQFSVKNAEKLNYTAGINLFIHSILITGAGFAADGIHAMYPLSVFFLSTAIYVIGPMNLYYYEIILYPQKPILKQHRLHLIPPLLVFVFEIFFQCRPYQEKKTIILDMYNPEIFSYNKIGIILGCLIVILYMSYLIREVFPFRNNPKARSESRVVIVLNLMAAICLLIIISGLHTGALIMIRMGGLILSVIYITLFIAHNRYPEFFLQLRREIRERRYHNSMLKGIDTDTLYYQLIALMEDEYVYRDDEITLAKLSARLSITPHQLSQFLNEKLGQNFSNYINSFRIEEAKKLLAQEPDLTVISICYHVGFNSKSAFNLTFKKITGENPLEYRRKHLLKISE